MLMWCDDITRSIMYVNIHFYGLVEGEIGIPNIILLFQSYFFPFTSPSSPYLLHLPLFLKVNNTHKMYVLKNMIFAPLYPVMLSSKGILTNTNAYSNNLQEKIYHHFGNKIWLSTTTLDFFSICWIKKRMSEVLHLAIAQSLPLLTPFNKAKKNFFVCLYRFAVYGLPKVFPWFF